MLRSRLARRCGEQRPWPTPCEPEQGDHARGHAEGCLVPGHQKRGPAPDDLLRMFGLRRRPDPLGAAFVQVRVNCQDRALLRVVDLVDDTYCWQTNRQLTVKELAGAGSPATYAMASAARSTRRTATGWRTSRRRPGLNAALWTTKYIDAAVAQLQAEGDEIGTRTLPAVPCLIIRNLNLLGRYSFTASVPAAGALRRLRDPDTLRAGMKTRKSRSEHIAV